MVSSGDECKDYLARTIISMCGGNNNKLDKLKKGTEILHEELCLNPAMDTFLDQTSSKPLQATLMRDGDIKLDNDVSVGSDAQLVIFFSKVEKSVTADNIQQAVSITSMSHSAIQGFYSSLHNVFMPLMTMELSKLKEASSKEGSGVDPSLGALVKDLDAGVKDLDAGLGSLARGAGLPSPDGEKSANGILKLEDEVSYWRDVRSSANQQERADFFSARANKLCECFSGKDDTFEDMVNDRLEEITQLLVEVWESDKLKPGYPQARMERLVMLCGDSCAKFVHRKFKDTDIWQANYVQVEREVRGAIEVCDRWTSKLEELNKNQERRWEGAKFDDARMSSLKKRLQLILDLRATHEALQGLLSDEERRGLHLGEVFSKFTGVQALHVGGAANKAWDEAITQYQGSMGPTEDRIVAKLRVEFESKLLPAISAAITAGGDRSEAQPYQLLQGFRKYSFLLTRQNISSKLSDEKQKLLSKLQEYVKHLSTEPDAHGRSETQTSGRNTSQTVNQVTFIKQLLVKVEQTVKAAKPLFEEASFKQTWENFYEESENFKSKLNYAKDRDFDEWKTETLNALNGDAVGSVALKTSAKVMSFDQKDGRLVVHYSEQLIIVLREARQLSALGFAIPPNVEKALATAHKFYHQAMRLKQVANFYNTIEDQIINSQSGMLLQEADAFEKVVKDQKKTKDGQDISWNSTQELAEYTEKLYTAMHNLSKKNKRLRKAHIQISEVVLRLINNDLVSAPPPCPPRLILLDAHLNYLCTLLCSYLCLT